MGRAISDYEAITGIDPLSFMAGYISLADRILAGFTTITKIPRYTCMLCKALMCGVTENAKGKVASHALRSQLRSHPEIGFLLGRSHVEVHANCVVVY